MSVVSVIREVVRQELGRRRPGDLGVVTSVFPHASADDRDNYACNVQLKNSGLELRKVPVAAPTLGIAAIPNVDDQVLVVFVAGDVNQPIIVGRLYDEKNRPPLNQSDEIVAHLPLAADDDGALKLALRSGGDHDPKRQAELTMGAKLHTRLSDGDPPVVVETEKATITVAASGDVSVETQGKLSLQAAGGLELKSDGSVDIEAGGPMKLKGATIDLN